MVDQAEDDPARGAELRPTVRPMNEHEAVERTRRDYDAVAELYDSMVR